MSKKQKRDLIRIAISGLLFILCLAFHMEEYRSCGLACFMIPFLLCGADVLRDAVMNLIHGQMLDEKFLMTIASVGAFCLGEYSEAVAVMLFYQIGEWFQGVAVGSSRRSITALMSMCPDEATIISDGREEKISPDEIISGDLLRILPGEKIPVDGIIVQGKTNVDTSMLTGESRPEHKQEGDELLSGCINLDHSVTIRCIRPWENSAVAKILEMVENATDKKAPVENFITRFARIYTPAVTACALALAFLPPLFWGQPLSKWVYRALTFLVVSCPCALVVSVPLSFFCGIGAASRNGILMKGAGTMELLAGAGIAAFDKTGTLTHGGLRVSNVYSLIGDDALLEIAACAEAHSRHPVAQSVLKAFGKQPDTSGVSEAEELPGRGMRTVINGKTVYAGNETLMTETGISLPENSSTDSSRVYIASEGQLLGWMDIEDTVKEDAGDALHALKALGIKKNVMLTGDEVSAAQRIAAGLPIDEVHARLLPGEKVQEIEKLKADRTPVFFVGDGINDAPVLVTADVGIAMGGIGSDAAIEAADMVLMDDRLIKLPRAIRISRKTMLIVRENIIFALGIKLLILVLGALGLTHMNLAVFGDVGVLCLCILNALRALTHRERP